MAVLAVGSVALDTVETPDSSVEEALGGSAVYFSCAASLFTQVRLVGVVGADFPREHVDFIAGRRIDITGLQVKQGETFRWHGRYHQDMNVRDTVDVKLNVFGEFDPRIPEPFRSTEYVFLANARPALQLKVLRQVVGRRFAMADTMDLWIESHREELEDLFKQIDGLLINDEEARMLTGASNLLTAAEQIIKMGPRVLVIKKGEHGSLLFAGGHSVALPAFPQRKVVDPTGAGDSFAGGLMGYVAEKGDTSIQTLRRATAYGTVAASFTVEDFSLRKLGYIARRQLDQRLQQYSSMLEV